MYLVHLVVQCRVELRASSPRVDKTEYFPMQTKGTDGFDAFQRPTPLAGLDVKAPCEETFQDTATDRLETCVVVTKRILSAKSAYIRRQQTFRTKGSSRYYRFQSSSPASRSD